MFSCGQVVRISSRLITALLICFLAIPIILAFFPTRQHPMSVQHDFGIGFDLTPSYGTVAVSYPNGSIQSIARFDGDAVYQEMMIRLSLKSSQHVHLPYQNVGEAIGDTARRLMRDSRKKLGLPASKDVGTLSGVIQALQKEAETFVGQPISAATISIPHLAALYGEDLHDAFEYLSLHYIEFYTFWNYNPIHSTIAAYAGNGRGLCANYTMVDECREEERRIPQTYILAISYTHKSLTASQTLLSDAYKLEESPAVEDLTLGYDARHDNSNEDFYWEKVRDTIRSPVVTSPLPRNITQVLVSGDAAQLPKFRQVLQEAIDNMFDEVPVILDDEPVYSAARGVAELAKRATYMQNLTTDDLNRGQEL